MSAPDNVVPLPRRPDRLKPGRAAADLFPVIEAAAAPQDGAALARDIEQVVRRYVVMDEPSVVAVVIWILGAHAHDAVAISPILNVSSPEKRCGKTTLLDLIGYLTPRPLHAASVSSSVVFRVIDEAAPTLLIDEADRFLAADQALIGVLNSGHRRRTAQTLRCVGDDHTPRAFSTWCPKVIAGIRALPDTLADRSITIALRRKTDAERVDSLRHYAESQLAPLNARCVRWATDNFTAIEMIRPTLPPQLKNRSADNWEGIFAIATLLDSHWPARVRDAAIALERSNSELSDGTQLLTDIRDVFREHSTIGDIQPTRLVELLLELEEAPWREIANGRPLTANRLARMLLPFGIRSALRRDGTAVSRRYRKSDFEDAFGRYLPPEGGLL